VGIIELVERQANNQIKQWHNAYLSKTKRRGAVAVVQWKKTKAGKDSENRTWYTLKNVQDLLALSDRTSNRLTNAYLTLNAFEKVNGQLARRTENLAQIRNIGVDIDCYTVGMTADQAAKEIQEMIAKQEIPNPNLVIWSGNGLQLIYSIEGGASPSLAWLTKHITTQLIAATTKLGADAQCTDITRVFRLPGSYNNKPGKPTNLVSVEMWRLLEYDLSELYIYCEPLKKRNRSSSKAKLYVLPKITDMGYKLRSLNLTRINDFYKLIDLRNGNIENRNVMTYDFAYCFALQTDNQEAVITQSIRMNKSFDDPLNVSEIERVAKNAFKDARAFWKAYLANGYTMNGLFREQDKLIKPKKNSTLIDHHGITPVEMKELQTIIDAVEKQTRRVAKRRAAGMKTLAEHNNNQKAKKADRAALLAQLKTEHPEATQRQLADMMGVTAMTISRLNKELSN